MSRANLATESWLDALVDGDPLDEHTVQLAGLSSAADKLMRVQVAFAQLHRTVPTSPRVDPHLRFHWRHLAVLDRLGAGGYGEVFRAYDSGLEREVALKLRRANNQFSAAAGRAFIEEARRLAQVRHPNVLAVHGAAVDQGRAGIWTDLLIGETLAARIIRDGPMRFSALLALATELAAALSAVHARAIVHGDLKPANVMCEAGQDGAYVLMDFGAGAQLDKSGQTRLYAGTLNFMAPEHLAGELLGTAVDIYALGAAIYFAATARVLPSSEAATRLALKNLRTREDLPKTFVTLLTTLLAVVPADRPSAAVSLARCHALVGEGERRTRSRLRMILSAILLLAVIGISTAAVLTIRAQSAVEIEANRAAATKDFLLAMMRNSNPYQSPNPTRSVTKFFESAIAQLPAAFSDDPRTEAQLLTQFAFTLSALSKDAVADRALLRADYLLTQAGVSATDEEQISVRSLLTKSYRNQRNYPKAIELANQQARLCRAPTVISARMCLGLLGDESSAIGFDNPQLGLALTQKNIEFANSAGLRADDRTAQQYYQQGGFNQKLGLAQGALDSFLTLTERALASLPPRHPGLLVALLSLAASADDLGEIELAQTLNSKTLHAYTEMYGNDSHVSLNVRMQSAKLALHAGNYRAARVMLRQILMLPNTNLYLPTHEKAIALSALVEEPTISEAQLEFAEQSRRQALGESSLSLCELRIDLASIAIKRGQWSRALRLLDLTEVVVFEPRGAGLLPMYWQQRFNLATLSPKTDATSASIARQKVNELLAQQHRALFDPVRGIWIGVPVLDAARSISKIKAAAKRIFARRAVVKN